MMSEKRKPTDLALRRNAKGQFLKGVAPNPSGKNGGTHYVQDLWKALKEAEKRHNESFLAHFIDMAYENPQVAIALAKKMLPDQLEGKGFGNTTYVFNDFSGLITKERDRFPLPTSTKTEPIS